MNRRETQLLVEGWRKLLSEGNSSESRILYHGSPYKFDKFEVESHFLAEGKPVVFGTDIRSIAIASLGIWNDGDFEQGVVDDDPPHMIEMYPGAFEKVYGGKKGYLYEVSGEFYRNNNLTRMEMISDEAPKIIRRIEIEDALQALILSDMQMVMYEEGKKFRKNDYMFDLDNLEVYVAITPESIDSVMKDGLLNAVTLIKDEEKVAMARTDPKEREEFIKSVKKNSDTDSYNGISVFFGEPDWSKITEEHFIKKWDLRVYKIDLGRFLKDYPASWVKGVELLPVMVGTDDVSDEDYDEYLEELGYDLSKGWEDTKRRELSREDIWKFGSRKPKDMWKWYDVEEYAGKKYAANVPHGFIMSEIGRIPPKYIEEM
jgi:hypothetical protein